MQENEPSCAMLGHAMERHAAPCCVGPSHAMWDHAKPCCHGHARQDQAVLCWTMLPHAIMAMKNGPFLWPFHGWQCCGRVVPRHSMLAMLDQAGLDHAIPSYCVPARSNHSMHDNATPRICGHSGPHPSILQWLRHAGPSHAMPVHAVTLMLGRIMPCWIMPAHPSGANTRQDHTVLDHAATCRYRGHGELCWARTMLNRAGLGPCCAGPCQPMLCGRGEQGHSTPVRTIPSGARPFHVGKNHSKPSRALP